jgi:uncharacterized protein YqhQ
VMSSWETISLMSGVLVNICVLVGGLWKLGKIANHVQRTFDYFALEHEILINDYCKRNDIKPHELPSRLERAPWWHKNG